MEDDAVRRRCGAVRGGVRAGRYTVNRGGQRKLPEEGPKLCARTMSARAKASMRRSRTEFNRMDGFQTRPGATDTCRGIGSCELVRQRCARKKGGFETRPCGVRGFFAAGFSSGRLTKILARIIFIPIPAHRR